MNNMDSLYIEPVTEEEIIHLVNNAKNKTSKGHDGLDMCLVKKIIPCRYTTQTYFQHITTERDISR